MEQVKLITNLEISLKQEINKTSELRDELKDSDRLIELRDKTINDLRTKARSKFGLEEVEDSFETAMRNELSQMRQKYEATVKQLKNDLEDAQKD